MAQEEFMARAIVATRELLGVDPIASFGMPWIAAYIAFGVAALAVAVWLARRYGRGAHAGPWFKRPRACPATPFAYASRETRSVVAQCVAATPPPGLNGTYVGDDKGTYYISQFGADVWWVGMSPAGGKAFTNVFKGVRSGDSIVGNWADVGLGATHVHGILHLLVSNNALIRTSL
jgi:hypothetical protein